MNRQEYLKKWRERNRAERAEWYQKNKEKRQTQMKAWREKNAAALAEKNREYKKKNAALDKLHSLSCAQKKKVIDAFDKFKFELDKYLDVRY